eukprot:scaffold485_cov272-Pinguiococcus_pyrenoidosus.AAC.2
MRSTDSPSRCTSLAALAPKRGIHPLNIPQPAADGVISVLHELFRQEVFAPMASMAYLEFRYRTQKPVVSPAVPRELFQLGREGRRQPSPQASRPRPSGACTASRRSSGKMRLARLLTLAIAAASLTSGEATYLRKRRFLRKALWWFFWWKYHRRVEAPSAVPSAVPSAEPSAVPSSAPSGAPSFNDNGICRPGEVQARLNFERGLKEGDLVTEVCFESLGFVTSPAGALSDVCIPVQGFSGSQQALGNAMIFDSTCEPFASGRDVDLCTAGKEEERFNVLIISEDGDQSDPDDDTEGGWLFFDFSTPELRQVVESVRALEILFIDVDREEERGTTSVIIDYANGDTVSQPLAIPTEILGPNSLFRLPLEAPYQPLESVRTLNVSADFATFAIDDIVLCVEPKVTEAPSIAPSEMPTEEVQICRADEIIAEINFELNLVEGEIVTELCVQSKGFSLTPPSPELLDVCVPVEGFSGTQQTTGNAMIFDSVCEPVATGEDADLCTALNPESQQNILIISEDGDQSDPDDDNNGGWLSFDFTTQGFQATFESVRAVAALFIDIDREEERAATTVDITYDDGTFVSDTLSFPPEDLGPTSLNVEMLGDAPFLEDGNIVLLNITSTTATFAIDDIILCLSPATQ